ncbi:MAG: hypothetical protein CL947_02180 [Epsilonproteobacteria bacterium]|nr:hypothetical protein [Campylobacterota bacterium]|tara:strand:+ start:762 stop:1814 length:1053 start_codon:yes stop_codon:yes gene_type:complete
MKKLLLFSLLGLSMHNHPSFTLVTQNILGPNTQDVASFKYLTGDYRRLDHVLQRVISYNADIMCFQEWDDTWNNRVAQADQSTWQLMKILKTNYQFVSFEKKGSNGGVVLYCKRQNWTVLDRGTMQLGVGQSGACAWGLLQNQKGEKVLVACLHLSRGNQAGDGRGGSPTYSPSNKDTGQVQLGIIVTMLKTLVGQHKCPVVLAGDFNTLYQEILNDTLVDLNRLLPLGFQMFQHNSWTSNDSSSNFASIDHVLYSQGLQLDLSQSAVGGSANPYQSPNVATAITKQQDVTKKPIHQAGFNSDHAPVFVTLCFTGAGGKSVQLGKGGQSGSASPHVTNDLKKALELAKML